MATATKPRPAIDARLLRRLLLTMASADRWLQATLAAGAAFDGYHPRLRALHEANAGRLRAIVERHGWPSARLVGGEAAEAAWLIAQHAISVPTFQRRCLALLRAAAARGDVPAWQPAYLFDRILVLEGRPQVYGTQFDWDGDMQLSPEPVADPDGLDERRARVGLPPLATAIVARRRQAVADGERPPRHPAARERAKACFARAAGWRPDAEGRDRGLRQA